MIKRVAAILFSLILLQVHAFALVGGPWGNSTTNIYGTYSAVLFPQIDEEDLVDESGEENLDANSLALFALVVKTEGFSEGYAVLFVQGYSLIGPVVGLGDPDSGVINGLIETGINLFTTITNPTFDDEGNQTGFETEIINYLGTGNGSFQAELIEPERSGNFGTSTTLRIEGEANLIIDLGYQTAGYPLTYLLDGYKSSTNTEDPIVPPADFGNQTLGGSGGGGGGTN